MFTGIIANLGTITNIKEDKSFLITVRPTYLFDNMHPGESIAVNGVCLTVSTIKDDELVFEVMPETMRLTTLGQLETGDIVNLERPMQFNSFVGGHLVSGHVDGIGTVQNITPEGEAYIFEIEFPENIGKFIAKKGSVSIDGVSLTVTTVNEKTFKVSIVTHTFENTIFKNYLIGSKVNLEVDLIARYLDRLRG